MDEEQTNNDLTRWFSTYGMITAERILGKYHITLPHDELLVALKSPFSFYHRILQIPLKNVLTGIVLQQASDYHIYAQKLFIDYLLAGESGKDPLAQGALTRESMEDERKKLVELGEEFHNRQLDQNALIAASQQTLIQVTGKWNAALDTSVKLFSTALANFGSDIKKSTVRKAINHSMVHCDLTQLPGSSNQYVFVDKANELLKVTMSVELKEKLLSHLAGLLEIAQNLDENISEFNLRVKEMSEQAHSFRTQFYEAILRITSLINLLPEYKINPEQDQINREPLYFDKSIGGA